MECCLLGSRLSSTAQRRLLVSGNAVAVLLGLVLLSNGVSIEFLPDKNTRLLTESVNINQLINAVKALGTVEIFAPLASIFSILVHNPVCLYFFLSLTISLCCAEITVLAYVAKAIAINNRAALECQGWSCGDGAGLETKLQATAGLLSVLIIIRLCLIYCAINYTVEARIRETERRFRQSKRRQYDVTSANMADSSSPRGQASRVTDVTNDVTADDDAGQRSRSQRSLTRSSASRKSFTQVVLRGPGRKRLRSFRTYEHKKADDDDSQPGHQGAGLDERITRQKGPVDEVTSGVVLTGFTRLDVPSVSIPVSSSSVVMETTNVSHVSRDNVDCLNSDENSLGNSDYNASKIYAGTLNDKTCSATDNRDISDSPCLSVDGNCLHMHKDNKNSVNGIAKEQDHTTSTDVKRTAIALVHSNKDTQCVIDVKHSSCHATQDIESSPFGNSSSALSSSCLSAVNASDLRASDSRFSSMHSSYTSAVLLSPKYLLQTREVGATCPPKIRVHTPRKLRRKTLNVIPHYFEKVMTRRSRESDGRSRDDARSHDADGGSRDKDERSHDNDGQSRDTGGRSRDNAGQSNDTAKRSRDTGGQSRGNDEQSRVTDIRSRDSDGRFSSFSAHAQVITEDVGANAKRYGEIKSDANAIGDVGSDEIVDKTEKSHMTVESKQIATTTPTLYRSNHTQNVQDGSGNRKKSEETEEIRDSAGPVFDGSVATTKDVSYDQTDRKYDSKPQSASTSFVSNETDQSYELSFQGKRDLRSSGKSNKSLTKCAKKLQKLVSLYSSLPGIRLSPMLATVTSDNADKTQKQDASHNKSIHFVDKSFVDCPSHDMFESMTLGSFWRDTGPDQSLSSLEATHINPRDLRHEMKHLASSIHSLPELSESHSQPSSMQHQSIHDMSTCRDASSYSHDSMISQSHELTPSSFGRSLLRQSTVDPGLVERMIIYDKFPSADDITRDNFQTQSDANTSNTKSYKSPFRRTACVKRRGSSKCSTSPDPDAPGYNYDATLVTPKYNYDATSGTPKYSCDAVLDVPEYNYDAALDTCLQQMMLLATELEAQRQETYEERPIDVRPRRRATSHDSLTSMSSTGSMSARRHGSVHNTSRFSADSMII